MNCENKIEKIKLILGTQFLVNLRDNINDDDKLISIFMDIEKDFKKIDKKENPCKMISLESFDKINEQIYKKSWDKLKDIHKKIKIKEFINKNNLSDKLMKEYIKNIIFKKSKSYTVSYNTEKCFIESITSKLKN